MRSVHLTACSTSVLGVEIGDPLCRRFTNTLALMVWISVAWIAYEMYFKVTDQYNEHWQYDWITSDFWHLMNYVFLCALCFLFRPSPLSTRFSYTDLDGGPPGLLLAAMHQAPRRHMLMSHTGVAGDESYEQIEKGSVPQQRSGKQEGFVDGDEIGKLE